MADRANLVDEIVGAGKAIDINEANEANEAKSYKANKADKADVPISKCGQQQGF